MPLPPTSSSSVSRRFPPSSFARDKRVGIGVLGVAGALALLGAIAAGRKAGTSLSPAASPVSAPMAAAGLVAAPDVLLRTLASGLPGITSIVSAGDPRLFLTE